MGKECVKGNVTDLEMNMAATIEDKRYQITTKTIVELVEQKESELELLTSSFKKLECRHSYPMYSSIHAPIECEKCGERK